MDANLLTDMDIDEIALCAKGAHGGAKIVIQKAATRETVGGTSPDGRHRAQAIQSDFALAVLKAKKSRR